jgi:hypothetical protein
MTWWWGSDIYSLLDTLHANQLRMLSLLDQILTKEKTMAVDLNKLTAEVAANTDATTSVVKLLNNLTQIIKSFPPSTDPVTQAALDNLVATLAGNDQAIAIAVTANTQSMPADVPPVVPAPVSAKAPDKAPAPKK